MASKAKNAIFPLVAGGVLVMTTIMASVTGAGQQAHLDAQADTLSSLQQKQETARAATQRIQAQGSVASEGAQAGRVTTDTKIIDDVVNRALTWDSDATYRQARTSMMRLYGLTEASVLMKSFLPPAPVNTDSKGNVYPYIDAAGLNSSVGDVTPKLLSVDGTKYSYMALVDVQSESSDSLGTGVNVATIFVTIDDAGKVSDLSGYASTTQLRSSE